MRTANTYAGSCNPPRKARQSRTDKEKAIARFPSHPQPILPKRIANSHDLDTAMPSISSAHEGPSSTPAKRGRKPSAISRSAREAQRKLNHSIIEKARRTKINEALATLRQLVPADFGVTRGTSPEHDEDDGDGDYEDGGIAKKKVGKKEEKEKEFKLEILIRTVAYMQTLLEKVSALEGAAEAGQGCTGCSFQGSAKRKRESGDEGEGTGKKDFQLTNTEVNASRESYHHTTAPSLAETPRLPSISSWLPKDSVIDPSLLPSTSQPFNFYGGAQLPSPPSSTRFSPIISYQVPPTLTLGPVAAPPAHAPISTPDLSPKMVRSPEDESAASLLLQISTSSPVFLPSSREEIGIIGVDTRQKSINFKAQTPSSIMGMESS